MKKFICKIFGHKTIDEVYAVRMYGRKPLYVVVNETRCERCGEIIRRSKSKPMRRSELLKNGWFIMEGGAE